MVVGDIIYILFSAINVLLYSRFQDFLPPRYRSVILSLYSIGDNMVYIGTCFIIGLGSTLGSWRYSLIVLGILLIMVGLWALMFVRDKCAISSTLGATSVKDVRPISRAQA